MSDYKPGTVAMAIRADGPEFLVVRTRGGEAGDYWSAPQGWPAGVSLHDIQGYRPLVVLDLDADGMGGPQRIANYLRACAPVVQEHGGGMWAGHLDRIADQIEQQVKPPKPAEPTGLGAVVEDAEGKRWMRHEPEPGRLDTRHAWYPAGYVGSSVRVVYDGIDAVRVLSDGVQP